ncbi:MAG: hypothetical protein JSR67_09380 [Proteobacteria bacterium]|nr:hypothetical protein [Pseudomonadota bacterium]
MNTDPTTADPRARAALRARNLRTLALLAALFFLPLAVSFYTYYQTDWRPARHVNHGVLIQPARPLPATAAVPLSGKWSLVYISDGDCSAQCRNVLYVMRQTRLALNTDMTRVQRIFLATGDCCDRAWLDGEHTGLLVIDATTAPAAALLAQFPADNRDNTLFIVDPLGNLIMRYDARRDPSGLLIDLKKLLKLSHIG